MWRQVDEQQTESLCKTNGHVREFEQEGDLVPTDYLLERASDILTKMEAAPFGHFMIKGQAGSGKMSLIKLTQQLYR